MYNILLCILGGVAIVTGFQASVVEGRLRNRYYTKQMGAFLEIHAPGKTVEKIALASTSLILGRRPRKCQIRLKDPSVSRIHALLFRQEGAFWIQPAYNEDDKCWGQVIVNGAELCNQPKKLRSGDRITLGQLQIYYREGL